MCVLCVCVCVCVWECACVYVVCVVCVVSVCVCVLRVVVCVCVCVLCVLLCVCLFVCVCARCMRVSLASGQRPWTSSTCSILQDYQDYARAAMSIRVWAEAHNRSQLIPLSHLPHGVYVCEMTVSALPAYETHLLPVRTTPPQINSAKTNTCICHKHEHNRYNSLFLCINHEIY